MRKSSIDKHCHMLRSQRKSTNLPPSREKLRCLTLSSPARIYASFPNLLSRHQVGDLEFSTVTSVFKADWMKVSLKRLVQVQTGNTHLSHLPMKRSIIQVNTIRHLPVHPRDAGGLDRCFNITTFPTRVYTRATSLRKRLDSNWGLTSMHRLRSKAEILCSTMWRPSSKPISL